MWIAGPMFLAGAYVMHWMQCSRETRPSLMVYIATWAVFSAIMGCLSVVLDKWLR